MIVLNIQEENKKLWKEMRRLKVQQIWNNPPQNWNPNEASSDESSHDCSNEQANHHLVEKLRWKEREVRESLFLQIRPMASHLWAHFPKGRLAKQKQEDKTFGQESTDWK